MHLDREACYRALLSRDARFDGRFFIAVRTTGIYCRPICPARAPKLQHVVFMPSAAAAQEAGFRPCLRCRPEASPDLQRCEGAAGTVSRAMTMIAAGAVNEATVGDLASRLGIGERQLRRLFQQHLGASPKAFAQTRRALLAKQLITQTRLPLAQVAFAAGYGSVRRFNDSMQQLYGRPPQRLRRGGPTAEATTSDITLMLSYRAPYDWSGIARFLAARAIPGVEHVEPEKYARAISIGGAQGTLVVQPATPREGDHSSLRLTIRFPIVNALPAIIERVRRMFDLAADPAVIGAHLSEDADMARRVAARRGLRIPGAWDAFEVAVCALIRQRTSRETTAQLAGRIAATYGAPLRSAEASGVDAVRFVFPAADCLVSPEATERLGIPRDAACKIACLARAAVANPDLFETTRGLDESLVALTASGSIGLATAHYVAMRALHEPDAFPPLRTLFESPPVRQLWSAKELRGRAAAWRPWRAYAALYLATVEPRLCAAHQEKLRETVARPRALADRDAPARV